MAQISVSVEKQTAFRDSVQPFSNVYTYTSLDTEAGALLEGDTIIDAIVNMEKTIHGTGVTFLYARMWSSGGSVAANHMIYEKALTGAGARSTNVNLDKERAVLAQWPAGLDSRGRTVYLRKWYHISGNPRLGASTWQPAELANTTVIASAVRTDYAAAIGAINSVGLLAQWSLCAPSGRTRDSNANPLIHPYLEHHQLGDLWRG